MTLSVKFFFSSAGIALLTFCFSNSAFAATDFSQIFPSKTVYVGLNVGGGSTEWEYLVDKSDGSIPAAVTNTPETVTEGGPSWGGVLGYDLAKSFALELQYISFADAHIQFSPLSVYAIRDRIDHMLSKTDAFSLSGKFFAQLPRTRLRPFAAIGVGMVRRFDALALTVGQPVPGDTTVKEIDCVTPYMSGGLNYSITRHWMLESGFQYYTGFGAAEIHPVYGFVPFAWDAYFRIAYQL